MRLSVVSPPGQRVMLRVLAASERQKEGAKTWGERRCGCWRLCNVWKGGLGGEVWLVGWEEESRFIEGGIERCVLSTAWD